MSERIREVLHLDGAIQEGAADATGPPHTAHQFAVTVLAPGLAQSGRFYTPHACAQTVTHLEGARAFADHLTKSELAERAERSIRDIVGFYHNAHAGPNGEACATLQVLESAHWLAQLLTDSVRSGHGDIVGISVDAIVDVDRTPGRPPTVHAVDRLLSADVVTRPSAGGRIERAIASVRELERHDEELRVDDDVAQEGACAMTSVTTVGEPEAVSESHAALPTQSTEQPDGELAALRREIATERAALRHERRLLACERALESSVETAGLPGPVADGVRRRFDGRVFEQAELDAELATQRDLLAHLTQLGMIRGMGYEKPVSAVSAVRSAYERLQEAFDATFDVHLEEGTGRAIGKAKSPSLSFRSIHEAYTKATGDLEVRQFGGHTRLLEAFRVQEADQTTASFSYLLGTSMNRKLLAEYQSWPAEWQKFCTIIPIKDFKQQQRVRLGAFGSLPSVAEDTAYPTTSLTDVQATYSATKRGTLVQISRESIINDDLQGIKQFPTKLAIAAAYTLAEFVYGFVLSSNVTNIYDGNVLFTVGGAHNNRGNGAALTTANVETGVIAMREQTNLAGKRLGMKPSYLIVPPELEFVALTIVRSAGIPGSNNNDINPMMGYMDVVVSPQIVNTVQWILSADPRIVDTIEIGFVGGQVNPELFIQDNPLYGLNFTQDVISYKVRHEYCGAVVDYRGLYSGF